MGSSFGEQVMRDQSRMETEAASRNSVIDEVARYILPGFENFRTSNVFEHVAMTDQIWDTDPMDACKIGASICSSFVTPHNSQWMMLIPDDDLLMKYQHVRLWYEQKTALLFRRRYDALSGFRSEMGVGWAQLLAFGNRAQTIDVRTDHSTRMPMGLAYRTEHVGQVTIDEDWQRQVIRTHRKFEISAEAAERRWGKRLGAAPKVMAKAMDPKKKHEKCCFIHRIEPNPNFQLGREDKWGKAWHECYVSVEDKEEIADGGTNAPSLNFSRYERSPNAKYGRGPGIDKLPDIKTLQQMELDITASNELAAMPGYGLHDDMQDNMVIIGPNELSYGAIDSRGNSMVQKLFDGGNTEGAERQKERLSEGIKRAFFGNILEINRELKTHITATDTLGRREDIGVILDPLTLQETEWFAPSLDREIECMAQLGDFDDMPGEVREAGGSFAIRYANRLTSVRNAAVASGILRMQAEVVTMAAVDPEATIIFNRIYPTEKRMRLIAAALDVPVAAEATPEEMEAFDLAQESAKQQQSALETLPGVAGAVKDLSQAASYANAA